MEDLTVLGKGLEMDQNWLIGVYSMNCLENQRSGQFKQKLPHKKLPHSWQSVPKQSFSKNCKEEN